MPLFLRRAALGNLARRAHLGSLTVRRGSAVRSSRGALGGRSATRRPASHIPTCLVDKDTLNLGNKRTGVFEPQTCPSAVGAAGQLAMVSGAGEAQALRDMSATGSQWRQKGLPRALGCKSLGCKSPAVRCRPRGVWPRRV